MSQEMSGDTSAWHQFIPYTNTLYEISHAIDDATLTKNYVLKYELLRRLYAKLHPLMNEKDRENHELCVVKCEDAYKKILDAKNHKKKKVKQECFDWMDFWEIELMDLWHKRVPFIPLRSNPEHAMMSGSY